MKVGDKVKLVNKREFSTFGKYNSCLFKMRKYAKNFDWGLNKVYTIEKAIADNIWIKDCHYIFSEKDFYVVQD